MTHDVFGEFDCTEIIEKIDAVLKRYENKLLDDYFLWAEASALCTPTIFNYFNTSLAWRLK